MVYLIDAEFLGLAYSDYESLSPIRRVIRWLQFGRSEGRFPSRAACEEVLRNLEIESFSASEYVAANRDLVDLIETDERALVHYLSVGILEGRVRVTRESLGAFGTDRKSLSDAAQGPDNWAVPLNQFGISPETHHVLGRFREFRTEELSRSFFRSPEFEFLWNPWPSLDNEHFLIHAFETMVKRCPDSFEFDSLITLLDFKQVTRLRVIRNLMEEVSSLQSVRVSLDNAEETNLPESDTKNSEPRPIYKITDHSFTLLGTRSLVNAEQWKSKAFLRRGVLVRNLAESRLNKISSEARSTLAEHILSQPDPACTVLVSVYNGDKYLEKFCDALKTQSIFEACEIIVVDANSKDQSLSFIESQLGGYKNVRVISSQSRISVYEAWNRAVAESRAPLITNWNIDDMRHEHSLEVQVGYMQQNANIDVCYQDVWVSFTENLTFAEIVEYGLLDEMHPVSARTLYSSNYVHNGPMWRRELHTRHGRFDTSFRSAADWEFWSRCLAGGAKFGKCAVPTVAYFVNPEGVSTRPGTSGVAEAEEIRRRFTSVLSYPETGAKCEVVPVASYPSRGARLGAQVVRVFQESRIGSVDD